MDRREPREEARRRTVPALTLFVGLCVLGAAIIVWLTMPAASAASTQVAPLSRMQEKALKLRDTFKECANCPEMVVVPAGRFTMGSPSSEPGHAAEEEPQHRVTIARRFAVGRFEATFNEWDACVDDGGCNDYMPADEGWGRGRRPVINVSWDDAKAYVAWLSKKTGKSYRLLSGSEYEYATRAGTHTVYPWGNAVGTNNANCHACGSQWDATQTAPVGSFAPNRFGLFDMVGNVREWTEDCYHNTYSGAPADGSAWVAGADCYHRVVRGGSWLIAPAFLRSASRYWFASDYRLNYLGFRVARTLAP
jgi:formylglycine-generating enzyme required for sulfatase activity